MPQLVQDWFHVWEDQPGIWVIEEPLHHEEVKSYLVLGSKRAVLIDTGMGVADIHRLVTEITPLPISVIQSHAHNDHIGGAWQFDDVGIHSSEAADLAAGQPANRLANWFAESGMSGPLPPGFNPVGYSIPGKTPTRTYNDGDIVDLGGRILEVTHAPGHSRGGLVLLDRANRTLYSTDVVYLRSLYLLNSDSSIPDYVATLERLSALVPELDRLYPSHGPSPIPPDLIPEMLNGMREIAAGGEPDQVEPHPDIEGGHTSETERRELHTHDFGPFRVLVAKR
jgi:hydroxyacylglutathione hydrolase